MRAIGFRTYGGPEVLEMLTFPNRLRAPGRSGSGLRPRRSILPICCSERAGYAVVQQGEWPYIWVWNCPESSIRSVPGPHSRQAKRLWPSHLYSVRSRRTCGICCR